ncbi:stromal interaction molecule 2-like isoform X1 [Gadus macrocephalus]|uniref:stromal interaction molecule 2-like isoform X1 n=2 Tax=Gadus macrocephalus TaxID=80720 RepID=UPI0028CB5792|nr:stromal interaction molecule 2-like isoform X1 [Gadus macrocephalus]
MLLLSPLLFFFLRSALLIATRGVDVGGAHNEDHRGFVFPGGSGGAGFEPIDLCMMVSPPCVSEADRYSLEALRNIHQMMDDDHDGGIEVEESVEFIIEDMKEQQTNKHSHLHREDQHITVEELWRGWKSSEVHNWTQDAVLRWLKGFVELPQYERNFMDFKVNGNTLPRIAANEPAFLSGHLRIQDQRDKQKLNIKALDVVLFGPPTRPPHNYMKDLLLIVSVVMGIGGCWFAQTQNKVSKIHISKMMKDLDSLQRAELSLQELQEQLERAQEEKRNVAEEKHHLEEKMRDEIMGAQQEAHRLHRLRQGAVTELSRLRYAEEELEQVRGALKQAEKDMQLSCSASEGLQLWLQLTHEVEVQYYSVKRQSAELQLASAKEEAEKIKKKRSSLLGTLHVAHSSSLDQVDHKILEAKNALSDVTACLRERLHRWQQVERLCGFPIFRNAGLAHLTAMLYSEPVPVPVSRGQASYSCQSSLHGSMEDLMEDSSASIMSQMPGSSLKRSPRPRGSVICRLRRPGVIVPPQATMISSDPDLLIPIRAPMPRSEDEEGRFINPNRPPHMKQSSLELYPDTDYMVPGSRTYPSSSSNDSSRKLYRDEAMEPFADASIRKTSTTELEASIEPPVQKISVGEVEASVELAQRKWKDKPIETPGLHMLEEATESTMDSGFRRKSNERNEDSLESHGRKILSNDPEADVEFAPRRTDLLDSASRNIYRDRSDLSQDAPNRKTLLSQPDALVDVAARRLTRNMMGSSMDSGCRKLQREGAEQIRDSNPRKLTRDSMGMSMDTGVRRLAWDKTDMFQFESLVRGVPKDKLPESIPARKISREELEYCAARTARDEYEMGVGSLLRTTPREKMYIAVDAPTGNVCWDKADVETAKQRVLRESEFLVHPEANTCPSRMGQPDLTLTSPWKQQPSDLMAPGPLCQLVYDGILEKSCPSAGPGLRELSASTPNLPQSPLGGEGASLPAPAPSGPPPVPPRASHSATTRHVPEGEEPSKDRDKGKKSSKLKNLFKKKKDCAPERLEGGLQKL